MFFSSGAGFLGLGKITLGVFSCVGGGGISLQCLVVNWPMICGKEEVATSLELLGTTLIGTLSLFDSVELVNVNKPCDAYVVVNSKKNNILIAINKQKLKASLKKLGVLELIYLIHLV